jgi:Uma2 family endonuclease
MAAAFPLPLRPITFEQYEEFEAPDGFRDELINGRIVVSPEAKPLHHEIAANVFELLKKAAGRIRYVAQRMNLRFPDVNSMPSPGVFVVNKKEWIRARDASVYPEGSEVLLAVEVNIYVRYGLEAWVIDPKKQTVVVRRLRGITTLKKGDAVQWNGKEIPLAKIFRMT